MCVTDGPSAGQRGLKSALPSGVQCGRYLATLSATRDTGLDRGSFTMSVLDTFRLDGKTALVTGGTKGLGLAMASALAQAGANIALCSRNAKEAQQAARDIAETTGRRTQGFEADITRGDSVAQLAADIQASLGPVDILVNNAGCNVRKPTSELTEDDWDMVVDTSAKGSFLCRSEERRVGK